TTRLVKAMDYRATVINCLTAGYPDGACLPVHFDTDREVIDAALAIIGDRPAESARVMRIRNTLALEEVEVSETCFHGTPPANPLTELGPAREFKFDAAGNLQVF